jgi:uncharacterized repeat protein (TIGR01451 family)
VVGPGEPKIANGIVTFTPGPYYAISDLTGNYTANIPSGNYTATYNPGWGFETDCPGSQTYSVNVSTPGSTVNNLDFGLDSVPMQDVRVLLSCPFVRRGITTSGYIYLSNLGAFPYNGSLTFVKNPLVNVSNFSVAPASNANDTIVWPVSLPGNTSAIYSFDLTGDLQLILGDTVGFVCYVDTPSIDVLPGNNRQEFDRIVIGSYDPNDKAVSLPSGANADGEIGMTDTTLIYRVRFQNTGTDTAFTVTVRDTMDSRLDLSTMQILASSHDYTVSIDPYGRVEFDFPNIMLPDSFVNEPASNGYIIYEVERFSNILEGNVITNRASIYFDFNAPILTNTVASQLCVPLSVDFNHATNGSTVSFTNQSSGTLVGRSWDFGDGNTTSGILSPTHTYSSAGVYTVCLTISSPCYTKTHCETIVICQEPTAAYQATPTLLNVAFQDQSSASAFSWSWTFGDGNTSTSQNPSHTYAQAGSYNVCLTVTDSCTSKTTCTIVNVTCPAPGVNFSSSTSFYQATFTNQSTAQSGATYAWDFGDGNSSTLQNPGHTYANAGNFNVCLTVNDVCGSISYCDTVNVTCPAPGVNFSSSTSFYQATFTNQSTAQSGATYAWDFGDGNTSTQMSPTHTYSSTGFFQACLTVNDLCGSATFCDLILISCPAPAAAFSWTQSQLQAAFNNQSAGTGTVTYAWDFGDGNSSTLQNPSHTYATDGNYLACLTITDDCGSVSYCDTVVAVCAPPQAAISYSASGLQVQFNDNTPGTIVTHFWDFGDGNTSSTASPQHTYTSNGTYTACLQVTNDCGAVDTTCVTLTGLVGNDDSGIFHRLSLYPNPNDGRFNLETELVAPGHLQLRIYNMLGKQITEMDQGNVQGVFQKQIDLGELPKGNYLLQFDLDGRTVNRIFTIQD